MGRSDDTGLRVLQKMFQFLFKYPAAIFSKGHFVLLGTWPRWSLWLFVFAAIAGLGWLVRSRMGKAAPGVRNWRAGIIWLLQSALAALMLLLLWQPAITVAELKPQQNIIAVLVDDSRSMAIADNGTTRQAQAVKALDGGVLADLQKRFQTRLYSLDSRATRIASLHALQPSAPATRIGDSLKQLVAETTDLPVGAIVLLSDGADNSGGIDLDTISALRNRRIPVHTVGFGAEEVPHDVEINDAIVAPNALAEFAALRNGHFPPARLRRPEGHAHRPRWRQNAGLATDRHLPATAKSRPKTFSSTPATPERRRCNSRSTRCRAKRTAPTTP